MKINEFLELDLLSLPGVEKRASTNGPYQCFTYKKDEIAFLTEAGLHIRVGPQKIYEERSGWESDPRIKINDPAPGWILIRVQKRIDAEAAVKLFMIAKEIPPEEFLPPPGDN